MFQFQRHQPLFAADDTGETGHPAAAQRFEHGKLGRNIEIIRLDGDPFHPPVTGGNSASSRAVPIA